MTDTSKGSGYMQSDEYRAAIEKRFLELGRDGANHDLKHPGRKQWERLRAEIGRIQFASAGATRKR